MARNIADYNTGTPVLLAGESGKTFVLRPGNVDRVVEFDVPPGLVTADHAVLTYNLHLIDGDDLQYVIKKGANLTPKRTINSNVMRGVQEIFAGDKLQVGKNQLHFVLESGAGSIEISNPVLWFQRTDQG
jgi:hypothetical protein